MSTKLRQNFDRIRIQIFFPCEGKCRWCNTYKKNKHFLKLYKSGLTEAANDFYFEILKRYRPKDLFISGGEPILYPKINEFVKRALLYVKNIYLYTSYQYDPDILNNLFSKSIPHKRLILTHSIVHFLPEKWAYLTNNFSYSKYIDNLLTLKELPFRKRIKFIINHVDTEKEIKCFFSTIKPNKTFEFQYKLINEQNNGFGKQEIIRTKDLVLERINNYNSYFIQPDKNVFEGISKRSILEHCEYRKKDIEVRFAYWNIIDGNVVFKLRFCPFFGSQTYHKFYLGKTQLNKIDKWFVEGKYKKKCGSCRLLNYNN